MSNKRKYTELDMLPTMTACDVKNNYEYYFNLLLNRIIDMFEWEGLPNTIDKDYLNRLLFLNGSAIIFKHPSYGIVCAYAAYGGEPNEYYFPTVAVVAQPKLGSFNLKLTEDCVAFFRSTADKLASNTLTSWRVCPTYGLLDKTATLLADSIASLNIAQKNTRLTTLVTAPTNASKVSAEQVLTSIYNGDPTKVVSESLASDIKVHTVAQHTAKGTLTELKEIQQYYIAQFYHSIGINSNYDMKRERLISAELDVNDEPLIINIDDMLQMGQTCCEQVNKMFGTNISMRLSDNWVKLRKKSEVKEDVEPNKPTTNTNLGDSGNSGD